MWRDLRAGIDIYKHGRSGKPKERVLFCDLSMTKLYWRAPGASLDPDMDDEALLEDSHDPKRKTSYDDSNHDSSNYRKEKHVNRRSSFAKSDSDRVVYFKDIISVSMNL